MHVQEHVSQGSEHDCTRTCRLCPIPVVSCRLCVSPLCQMGNAALQTAGHPTLYTVRKLEDWVSNSIYRWRLRQVTHMCTCRLHCFSNTARPSGEGHLALHIYATAAALSIASEA